MNELPHPTTATTTETLYDLWERSRQPPPPPPREQHFYHAATESLPWSSRSTTGISILDAALSWGRSDDTISPSSSSSLFSSSPRMPTTTPTILDITGDAGTGKTSTLLTYAARFLARTRRQFPPSNLNSESTIRPSPSMVILFDNHRNVIHPARSVYDKLYVMIQQQEWSGETTEMNRHDKENHSDNNNMTIVVEDDDNVDSIVHGEVMECLQRLHIARVEDFSQWVLLLETLRHELLSISPATAAPTPATVLLLWDDFLDDVMLTVSNFSTTRRRLELAAAMRMDVIRQLERLLDSGGPMVTLVTTTTTTTTTGTTTHHNNNRKPKRTIGPEWNRCVTHSIHLERTVSSSVGSTTEDFLGSATITHHHPTITLSPPPPIPFVISRAHGIVS